ncbi:MAG: hypothetical protein HFH91_07650 [Lachnospiraceae bacterium]|nr:hypothetical protein [Lachnospiraceae bacterium]
MSNDLISRSALMQSLRGNVLIDVTPNLEQAIAEQPTADYVDKVIDRLTKLNKYEKKKSTEYDRINRLDLMDEHNAKAEAYRDSIKIVKYGGIE